MVEVPESLLGLGGLSLFHRLADHIRNDYSLDPDFRAVFTAIAKRRSFPRHCFVYHDLRTRTTRFLDPEDFHWDYAAGRSIRLVLPVVFAS